MKSKKTIAEFLLEAKTAHGDKYDYSKVEYTGSWQHVKIICKTHGVFEQLPTTHINGHGCKRCMTESTNINRYQKYYPIFVNNSIAVHGNIYDYSKTFYKTAKDKVIITCKKHGDFLQSPIGHISGRGCTKCGRDVVSSKLTKPNNNPFLFYKNQVRNLTNKFRKTVFLQWDGYDYYDKEFIKNNCLLHFHDKNYPTIDHKISIFEGFKNNTSPQIIADIKNLVITKRRLNSKKGFK